jgi:hypothetical protein
MWIEPVDDDADATGDGDASLALAAARFVPAPPSALASGVDNTTGSKAQDRCSFVPSLPL